MVGGCLGPLTGSTHLIHNYAQVDSRQLMEIKIIQSNGKLSVTLSECFDRNGEIGSLIYTLVLDLTLQSHGQKPRHYEVINEGLGIKINCQFTGSVCG